MKAIVNLISNNALINPSDLLVYYILSYFCLVIFMFLISSFYEWTLLMLIPNLTKDIGLMLMKNITTKPYEFFQQQFSGSIANKINDVAKGIADIINIFIENFLGNILALLVAIYAIYKASPILALVLTIWIIVFLSFSLKFSGRLSKLSNNTAQKRSDIVGLIVDILTNILSIRVFNSKKHENQTLTKMYQKFIDSYQKREWLFIKIHTIQEMSFIIYQILCFVWLYRGMKGHTITPGDFTMVVMLNISIMNTLHTLSRNIRHFAESFGNVIQGLNVIYGDTFGSMNNKNHIVMITNTGEKNYNSKAADKGEIRFINLNFSYPMSDPIFTDLSLIIYPLQKVGLVGYSGSGKTTFMNLILGLFEANSGQIFIDGQDINKIPREVLYNTIGIIPQDINLFNRTLMENIRYGRIDATNEEVIEAAKKAKAHGFISNLPEGYNSLVGERGIKLSGGERQRIAIARAILKNAPILLLDEATNQLDSITEHEIQESLNELMLGKSTIVIAHRLSTILHLDRILVFDKGKIVQDGTHKDLIKQDGLYKILWQNQSHGFLPVSNDHI
jgi:ATP-binding cassette subfamily B protein